MHIQQFIVDDDRKRCWDLIFISAFGNTVTADFSFFISICIYSFPFGTGIGTFPETDRGVVSGS
jgi:hypothetical protein